MSKIELFNNQLNSSNKISEKSNIANQIDYLLKSIFSTFEYRQNALIIGAGNCSDFSLKTFAEDFDQVSLSDIDQKSVERQIESADIPNKLYYKLTFKQAEYTGFEEIDFFKNFKPWLASVKDPSSIEKYMANVMKEVQSYQFLPDETKVYDFIYVSPIYTQLIFQQFTNELAALRMHGVLEHILKYAEDVMLSHMTTIIDRFNNNIVRLLKPHGTIVVLSDIFELQVGSDFYQRIKNAIGNKDIVDGIYNDYLKEYGYGFGDYGLYNLDQKITSIRERWMLWEFSESKHFLVKLKIYHSKKEEK